MRREAVLVMQVEVEVSQRRACGLMESLSCDVSVSKAEGSRTSDCGCGCASWPKLGAGSATVVCRSCCSAKGWQVNHKRVYRLYVEEKLALRRKRGRKRSTVRQPLPEAVAANQVWSVDFMTDALSSGRRFRTLNIVDDYTRECLAIEVDTSLGGMRVVRVLEELKQRRRTAAADPQRQRTRVREPSGRSMGLRARSAVAHDPTRTTDGERLRGEFQRALPR